MMNDNGQQPAGKPRPDVNLLRPNDYRRMRAKLDGRDPDELLGSGITEDVIQALILGFKLRDDPSFTWEQAGETAPAEIFDMTAGREPDPQTGPPGSPGPATATKRASGSKTRRPGRAGARS
jgi:hypothetical protein